MYDVFDFDFDYIILELARWFWFKKITILKVWKSVSITISIFVPAPKCIYLRTYFLTYRI